jgi:hypothetical protein
MTQDLKCMIQDVLTQYVNTPDGEALVSAIFEAWPNARIAGEPSPMIDPTPQEIRAIELASAPAGQYIESIGKTDMATWSESEWLTFLEVVVTGFQDGMQSRKNQHAPGATR